MKLGGEGGANTKTGLRFEGRTSIRNLLSDRPGYDIQDDKVLHRGQLVANLLGKNALYQRFLEPRGVDWRQIISRRLLPDEALFVPSKETLFIIEMKFQQTEGSVDEKLQTCDFKKRQYSKLVVPLGIRVEYIYILSEWFKDAKYRDVLDYVSEVGCRYFFVEIPLAELGLPS